MPVFVDFDDTLVLGPITWAIETVLPDIVRENNLSSDPVKLQESLLKGQEEAANGADEAYLLNALFTSMGWPAHLQRDLAERTFERYVPHLFDDALPFLRRMQNRKQAVYVLSNNNHAAEIAQGLGMAGLLTGFFTPKSCGLERGKPYREIWDFVANRCETKDAMMIGDDPWSDGTFADTCGIACTIVDRLGRFDHLAHYRRVRSLDEIK
jgi:FMN phosphatase YigB (HAD superfamily)